MESLGFRVDPVNGVAFSKREIHVPIARNSERAWTFERRSLHRCSFRSCCCLAGSGVGFNDAGIDVQPANPLIAQIANQKIAVFGKDKTMWLAKLRLGAWTAVAA